MKAGNQQVDAPPKYKHHIRPALFIEIGKDQESQIIPLFEQQGWKFVQSWKDLGGITRILYFQNR